MVEEGALKNHSAKNEAKRFDDLMRFLYEEVLLFFFGMVYDVVE